MTFTWTKHFYNFLMIGNSWWISLDLLSNIDSEFQKMKKWRKWRITIIIERLNVWKDESNSEMKILSFFVVWMTETCWEFRESGGIERFIIAINFTTVITFWRQLQMAFYLSPSNKCWSWMPRNLPTLSIDGRRNSLISSVY